MQTIIRAATLALGTSALLGFAGVAQAAFVFSNDGPGDGSLSGAYPAFTITGANNGAGETTSFYLETEDHFETIQFNWFYVTADTGGGVFDPAGYILNGVQTQLSLNLDPGVGSSGFAQVALKPGDVFGFYVYTQDALFGAGALGINQEPPPPPPIPEPGNTALMLAGLGALFAAARLRRTS
ncbi:MAG: PEP-CTERM sorting domain-containing protein [Betaproteobacteria bacterium]